MKEPHSHRGYTMVIDGYSCDTPQKYAAWLKQRYPSLTVDYRPRQVEYSPFPPEHEAKLLKTRGE